MGEIKKGVKRSGAIATCERREPKSNNSYIYGLTVRHNPKYKDDGSPYSDLEKRTLYERLIGSFEQKGLKITNVYYERKNGLHFHARAEYHKKLYFKAWQKKPFHVLFKNIYDESGWKSYCAKEEQKVIMQQYLNEYGFLSSSD